MSHKHKRSASQRAENGCEGKVSKAKKALTELEGIIHMATDSMKKYKEGFDKEDFDKMKEALKELEEVGKLATKEGDTSMSKLIPVVIDQLKSQKLKPHEEEEAVDEVNLDPTPTVDDYLKSHEIKPHEEEEAVDEVKM